MNPTNTGSFGAAAGGMSSALQQVMSQVQSGQYSPATSQVTQGAPGAATSPQPPTPTPVPTPTPPQQGMGPGTQGMPQPQGGAGALPFNMPESIILVKALDNRLRAISKKESAQPQGGM